MDRLCTFQIAELSQLTTENPPDPQPKLSKAERDEHVSRLFGKVEKYVDRFNSKNRVRGELADKLRETAWAALFRAAMKFDPAAGAWEAWAMRFVETDVQRDYIAAGRKNGKRPKEYSIHRPVPNRRGELVSAEPAVLHDFDEGGAFVDEIGDCVIDRLPAELQDVARALSLGGKSRDELAATMGVSRRTIDRRCEEIAQHLRAD